MKRSDLIMIHQVFQQMANVKNTKFAYFITKNMKVIRPEIETISELNQISPEYREFESKRVGLCEKYGEKDKDGNLLQEDGKFKIKNKKTFESKFSELKKKYGKVIEEKISKDKEFQDFLTEDLDEEDFKFYKIKLDDMPELSAKQISILEPLIREEEE